MFAWKIKTVQWVKVVKNNSAPSREVRKEVRSLFEDEEEERIGSLTLITYAH